MNLRYAQNVKAHIGMCQGKEGRKERSDQEIQAKNNEWQVRYGAEENKEELRISIIHLHQE